MTPERLAEIERLMEAATPGPWVVSNDPNGKPHQILGMFNGTLLDPVVDCRWASATQRGCDDYDFIAAARTAVPELVQEVRRLREALEDIRDCHLGDCPAASDELSHAKSHVYHLRCKAREALEPHTGSAGT
jgi:hypothetical protein